MHQHFHDIGIRCAERLLPQISRCGNATRRGLAVSHAGRCRTEGNRCQTIASTAGADGASAL
eukprot:6819264-Pyramimonas_sp.AAC.1